jgi:hypothetical protein
MIIVAVVGTVSWIALKVMWDVGRPFDREVWSALGSDGGTPRLEMADRLVARGALLGMTRKQVVQLLGDPPASAYFKSFDLVYRLGDERGFISIDSEWLVLRLDQTGRVVECLIVTD